ncbi:MAG: hypothetical protein OXH11_04675, partial [Candidatus Aminicenantes bacterium]|nr:hypothetical protein [Candidatus Aminicenantes bacterium]
STGTVDGLVDLTFQRTPKLTEVAALNTMLDSLDATLLELTSDAVFSGGNPAEFVHGLSDTSDYFLGAFTHTDLSRYLMVVNTRCGTAASRPVTVTLDAADLRGASYDYALTDVYRNAQVAAGGTAGRPSFADTLAPGQGILYRVEAGRVAGPAVVDFDENGTASVASYRVEPAPAGAVVWSLSGADADTLGIDGTRPVGVRHRARLRAAGRRRQQQCL